jgi:hypothetical protein
VSLTPYFTMKGRNLSFRINTYDIDSYLTYVDELKRPKRPNFLKKENQKIWVHCPELYMIFHQLPKSFDFPFLRSWDVLVFLTHPHMLSNYRCPRIMAEKLLKGEIITEFNGNIVSLTPYFTMKGRTIDVIRINSKR